MTKIVWTSWGGSTATGRGTLTRNTCDPNCAQGGTTSGAVRITLSDLSPISGTPRYGRVTVTPMSGSGKPSTASLPG